MLPVILVGISSIIFLVVYGTIMIYKISKLGEIKMYYYMMNETEAKNVLILINRELKQLEGKDDCMSKHDYDVLSKLKKHLVSTFTSL